MRTNPITRFVLAVVLFVCFAAPCLAQSITIPPKPPPAPARWRGLIGEYGTDDNLVVILERDGRLAALFKRQEASPLAEDSVKDTYEHFSLLDEVSKDRFRFPPYSSRVGQLVFRRDARGRATQVQLDQDNGAVARPRGPQPGSPAGVGRSGRAQYIFQRRQIEPESGNQLRIKPVRPVPRLLKEALVAQPPKESGDFRKADLVELTKLDPTIRLEIRYATTNNFLGTVFYSEGRAFMQRPAAEAVVRANRKLKAYGYGLLIHDAYRPWYVTKVFWDATPEDKHVFVADPSKGSRHNRGCAVDLTLYDLKTKKPVEMVSTYDETTARAYPDYPGGTSLQRWHRQLLREVMESEGFTVYSAEWWHFDYKDWQKYKIGNVRFELIQNRER